MQLKVIILTIVKISSLMVAAQQNLALKGTVSQSSTFASFTASWATREPKNNDWRDGCSATSAYQLTAWWRLKLPELVYVTNVNIYYRRGFAYRMDGFSLYMSNGTVDAADKSLCYSDLPRDGFPNITQDIDCYTLTKNVYFFNNRSIVGPRGEGAFIDLCYIAIYGCWKGTWGENCNNACSANCIGNHCYPGNGSCVWGCACLRDTCDTLTSVCLEGCKAGFVGQYCNITKYSQAIEETGRVTAIIGCICAAILVVTLALILYVVCRRLLKSQKRKNHSNIEKKSRDTINNSPRNEQHYEDLMRMEATSTYQELTIHSVSNDYDQINQDYVNH